ncbi:FAD-linked oxidoreductase-like protein [Ilyonectria destructans]|nr:FAD-linked oxidoreductase-like protein [Ilyonectria destructans]
MLLALQLLRPTPAVLNMMAKSKSAILNANRKPFLNRILRWTIYNHFCARSNKAQVAHSLAEVKDIGYLGVTLGWAKEVVLSPVDEGVHPDNAKFGPACCQMIDEWKEETLSTLRMLGLGDFLAAYRRWPISLDAMKARQLIPEPLEKALGEICLETQKQGSRLWIDDEQQMLQPGLDEWVIVLMRRYNQGRKALVCNTIQTHLKGSRVNAERHITQAAKEGWTLGLKFVRGAYIEHERIAADLPTATVECSQVMGMADELSCALLDQREQCTSNSPTAMETAPAECMEYLYQRAVENRGAVQRTGRW